MTRKSDGGIIAFKKAGEKEMKNFSKLMKELSFHKLSMKEKLLFIMDEGVKPPKRVTPENVLQDQYQSKLIKQNDVFIHVGLINKSFAEKGSSWVLLRDINGKVILSREFYKNTGFSLLRRLSAYAIFFKNIANASGTSELQKVPGQKNKFQWVHFGSQDEGSTTPFDILNPSYMKGLSKEQIRIIRNKEIARRRYFERSAGTVKSREYETRTPWIKR